MPGLALALFFALFYSYHLAPGVLWGEPARRANFVLERQLAWLDGGGHALGTLLGILFDEILPLDTALAQNLLSAACGVLTLWLFFRLLLKTGLGCPSAMAGAAALGVSHTFWFMSVVAETYTLTTLLLVAYLWRLWELLRRPSWANAAWSLAALALGALQHMIFFLFGAVAFLVCLARFRGPDRRRWLLLHAACLAGAVACLALAGSDQLLATAKLHWQYWVQPSFFPVEFRAFGKYLAYQFPVLALPLGLWGAWRGLKERGTWGTMVLSLFAALACFTSLYAFNRKFFLATPAYLLFAVSVGWGVEALRVFKPPLGWAAVGLLAVLPPATYASAYRYVKSRGIHLVTAREIPYRDVDRYFLWPGKRGEDGAGRFARELLAAAGPNGLILADYTVFAPLNYVRAIEGAESTGIWMTDNIGPAGPGEIQNALARVIDPALAAGRRVVLATPESVRILSPAVASGHYEAFPWLAWRYAAAREGNCYVLGRRPDGGR